MIERGRRSLTRVLVVCAALATCPARAGDWPRWRGPEGTGAVSGAGIFAEGPFDLAVAWRRPLGAAYSGISIVGDRLVTLFADGGTDYVVALDPATGEEIWRRAIAPMFPPRGGSEGGGLSVPVIDGDRVYALGAAGHLVALRLRDGGPLWSRQIDRELGARSAHFGFATTPLVVGDRLLVQAGGGPGRSLVALDALTGTTVWSTGDDPVGYQSPVLVSLAARRQVVAVTDRLVTGVDPASGEELWSHPHGVDDRSGYSTAVPVGDDRFLLVGRRGAAAFDVTADADGFRVREAWRTTELKGSFATPVYFEGHVYGYSGEFLTCVSASDGAKVWRSRPPGGQGLILVDGHLVVLGAGGRLVVGRASPEGYVELAGVDVTRGSPTYPSFAGGMFFVRDTREIAAVKVVPAAQPDGDRSRSEPASRFESFVREVERSDDRSRRIDEFLRAQGGFPIVEDDRLVHFLFRGDVEDVAISGSMTQVHVQQPLFRVKGTDLFYRTFPIEPGARWEYEFTIDFDQVRTDPWNPRRAPAEGRQVSELILPGFQVPDHLAPYAGSAPGRLETFDLASEALGEVRKVRVYLPPDHDQGKDAYPVLILTDGKPWLDLADLPNSLDNLIGRRISAVIAAFVPLPRRAALHEFGAGADDHVTMLADELVPELDRRFRTLRAPESRAVVGVGTGAMMAAYAAIRRPGVFGNAGGCSFQLVEPLGPALLSRIDAGVPEAVPAPRFHILWSRYDLRREEWGMDLAADSRRLFEALRARGHDVGGGEVLDSAGWGGWRGQVANVLAAFFPP